MLTKFYIRHYCCFSKSLDYYYIQITYKVFHSMVNISINICDDFSSNLIKTQNYGHTYMSHHWIWISFERSTDALVKKNLYSSISLEPCNMHKLKCTAYFANRHVAKNNDSLKPMLAICYVSFELVMEAMNL